MTLGQIHFDKFLIDLALMLGDNLLMMNPNEVCYVFRKVYQAMTHRFPEDMQFVQWAQIKSPFGIETILEVQRNKGKKPQEALIIPSSVPNANEGMTNGNDMKIILTNEQPNVERRVSQASKTSKP